MALAAKGLELVLVNGTAYYVALGTALDLLAGTLTEISDTGYARKGHSAWITETTADEVIRKNNGSIVFDPLVSGAEAVTHWAIFDALTLGNMIAGGPILNLSGVAEPIDIHGGDEARFSSGELKIVSTPGAT